MCGNSVEEFFMGRCKGFVMETTGYVSAAVAFYPWMLLNLDIKWFFSELDEIEKIQSQWYLSTITEGKHNPTEI